MGNCVGLGDRWRWERRNEMGMEGEREGKWNKIVVDGIVTSDER
jgi:hypothetical protein